MHFLSKLYATNITVVQGPRHTDRHCQPILSVTKMTTDIVSWQWRAVWHGPI